MTARAGTSPSCDLLMDRIAAPKVPVCNGVVRVSLRSSGAARYAHTLLPAHISMNLIALTGKRLRMKVGRQLWRIVVTLNRVKTDEDSR